MRDAGMDSWQILHSGTKAVAEHFGTLAETGTVAAGKRADLVLLGADPVADIANIRRIDGVMVGGRWLPAADIATELEAIARRNGR
jgi:imidazolonepropionase-like amidohydrolase